MLLGRDAELRQLNQYYMREGSDIVVLYGQKGIGKTSLVREFTKDKNFFYYRAVSCCEREQIALLYSRLNEMYATGESVNDYETILSKLCQRGIGKKVIIIDEFQNMMKTGSTFFHSLYQFQTNKQNPPFLAILCSSSVCFVENNMIKKMGEAAHGLSGLMKLRKLRLSDLRKLFPAYDGTQILTMYAVLDGIPGLWKHMDAKLSAKENLLMHVLDPDGFIVEEACRDLKEELRETSVYNTILSALAQGINTLNELYLHTGFSRAKISVYLKSLMELELVEKVFSYDTKGHANTRKGMYRIKNHAACFYYRFLYPHRSDAEMLPREVYYEKYVEKELKSFVDEYFKEICREYLEEENKKGKLPVACGRIGEWVGKKGSLDIVAGDENGNMLIGTCIYKKPFVTYEDYERLLDVALQAKVDYRYIYMFGIGRFDEKLILESKVRKNIRLIPLGEMLPFE